MFEARDVPVGIEYGWLPIPDFVCVRCGDAAVKHPDTNLVWGCERCPRITDSVSVFFEPIGSYEERKGRPPVRNHRALEKLAEMSELASQA